ncbi:MAG: hypothetical protein V1736_05650 [Pseudomonadota bacterium]
MLPSSQIILGDSLNMLPKGPRSTGPKTESSTPFERVLEREFSPVKNCLGVSSDAPDAPSGGNFQEDKTGLKQIALVLKSLKEEVSKTGSAGEVVLSRPDELKLTEFLEAFGLSKEQISKLKDECLTGEEGEYRLDILFAMLNNQISQAAGKPVALVPGEAEPVRDEIAISDLTAINAMLEEFGLKPNEVAALQARLVSDKGTVAIKDLIKQLKDLSEYSSDTLPAGELAQRAVGRFARTNGIVRRRDFGDWGQGRTWRSAVLNREACGGIGKCLGVDR